MGWLDTFSDEAAARRQAALRPGEPLAERLVRALREEVPRGFGQGPQQAWETTKNLGGRALAEAGGLMGTIPKALLHIPQGEPSIFDAEELAKPLVKSGAMTGERFPALEGATQLAGPGLAKEGVKLAQLAGEGLEKGAEAAGKGARNVATATAIASKNLGPIAGVPTRNAPTVARVKTKPEPEPSLRDDIEAAVAESEPEVPVESPQARVARERRMLTEALPKGANRADYASRPTVDNPQRVDFPDIYLRPDKLVARAKVAPEDPLLKQLFGVTRQDLYDISEQGTRRGNIVTTPYDTPGRPRGSEAAQAIMTPRNAQRLVDIISEARKRPELFQGMASWYTMDPMYQHFVRLFGPERAAMEYKRFNTVGGMASPGSEVLTEINRGTAANWLEKEGRFQDFLDFGGMKAAQRERDPRFPTDMSAIISHPYHSTSQALPMERYFESGNAPRGTAKVPSYVDASGVPEVGFQTDWPVGDAHYSRLGGLADTRGEKRLKGKIVTPGQSASVAEMQTLTPWFNEQVAAPSGVTPVGGQGVIWGAGSNATGVTSPIGAPKLELIAAQMGKAARRMGISPEEARDMVLTGKGHAGFATPEMLATLAATSGGAAALAHALRDDEKPSR